MAEAGSAILLISMFRLFRLTRTLVILITVALLAGAVACLSRAGHVLVHPSAQQMPREADAIIVLSGSQADRWLEAYELWREKRAPVIALSPGYPDGAVRELERRGIDAPTEADIARRIMIEQMGVPPGAIVEMRGPLDNTAAEAAATRALAQERRWDSVIVVTSLAHTRRTAIAMKRALEPAGISVQIRGSRFDRYEPAAWWRSRLSTRWVLTEWPKLAAYWLGMGE